MIRKAIIFLFLLASSLSCQTNNETNPFKIPGFLVSFAEAADGDIVLSLETRRWYKNLLGYMLFTEERRKNTITIRVSIGNPSGGSIDLGGITRVMGKFKFEPPSRNFDLFLYQRDSAHYKIKLDCDSIYITTVDPWECILKTPAVKRNENRYFYLSISTDELDRFVTIRDSLTDVLRDYDVHEINDTSIVISKWGFTPDTAIGMYIDPVTDDYVLPFFYCSTKSLVENAFAGAKEMYELRGLSLIFE